MANNYKKVSFVFVIVYTFFAFAFLLPNSVGAQTEPVAGSGGYQLLAPIPNFCNSSVGECSYVPSSFNGYVNAFIRLMITVAAILAVAMVVYGGFEYMTSENLGLKEKGKGRIQDAFIGIILLAASFLILKTINPDILNFTLDIPVINTAPSANQQNTAKSGTTLTAGQANDLKRAGIIPLDNGVSTQGIKDPGQRTTILNAYRQQCINKGGAPESYNGGFDMRCLPKN